MDGVGGFVGFETGRVRMIVGRSVKDRFPSGGYAETGVEGREDADELADSQTGSHGAVMDAVGICLGQGIGYVVAATLQEAWTPADVPPASYLGFQAYLPKLS